MGNSESIERPISSAPYRQVMIPLTVLRRLDCVLEESKQDVLQEYKKLKAQDKPEDQIETI